MLLLSIEGWLNGISASAIVLGAFIFGSYCIYTSIKSKIKLLFYFGVGFVGASMLWLADLCDFMAILLVRNNLNVPYLSFMWLPVATTGLILLGIEFVYPKRRLIAVLLFIILSFPYEFAVFLDTNAYTSIYPINPGEDLIDHSINLMSFVGVLSMLFVLFSSIICVFGLLYQSIKSKGVIRKKMIYLLLGNMAVIISSTIDGIITLGVILVLTRIVLITGYLFLYLGLKEESAEPKEKEKKEVHIEKTILRLSQRPDTLTEEEVSISKEKKICLVCKGKLEGFNFICKDCGTLYCEKCANAMMNSENACWVCNTPLDPSKPSKPYYKEKQKSDVKISVHKEVKLKK